MISRFGSYICIYMTAMYNDSVSESTCRSSCNATVCNPRQAWIEHERRRHLVSRKKERRYWSTRLCDKAKLPRQLWRSLQTLMGAGEKNELPKNSPSAQQFADNFDAKIATVRQASGCGDFLTELPHSTVIFDCFQPSSNNDVRSTIVGAPSKSCSLDPLPTNVLKIFLPELLPFITDMCNASLQQGCLQPSERHAIIKPRIKKASSDPSAVQNYRPVSNLTYMSKIVERLVCHQLVEFFECHSLLPSLQSAYRRKHSTKTAVLKVITNDLIAADWEATLLCMLDLSAAFDTVEHDILIDRLINSFGVNGLAFSWIQSFLRGRTQSVIVAGEQSSRSSLICGGPQGTVLGPILFLIYCADVIAIARRCGLGVHSYADDCQLYFHADPSSARDKIQWTSDVREIP